MAESSDSQNSVLTEEEQALLRRDLDQLKRDLDGWRIAFLPIRSLLTWEKPYYPAIIFGVLTFVFALIWIIEPSVMTTFAVLGLVTIAADFIIPFVSPFIFPSVQWTGREQEQFEDACERLLHFRNHVSDCLRAMAILKHERPKIYVILVMGALTTFAWIGQLMNNLFLSYFIMLAVVMVPGLRQTKVMQEYGMKYWNMVKQLIFGRVEVIKKKEN
ncbi:hypothetical protein ACOMHN_049986 [Nucella lapillus]